VSEQFAVCLPFAKRKYRSPFFREMLEAGTTGGVVPLDASSLQLKFIMQRVTAGKFKWDTIVDLDKTAPQPAISNEYGKLWNLIELHGIAQKYLFEDVCSCIQHTIVGYTYEHPPLALSFACQCNPPNAWIARAALQRFDRTMGSHMVGRYFLETQDYEGHPSCNPLVKNFSLEFARELGVDALLAYTKVEQQVFDRAALSINGFGNKADWSKFAELFIVELGIEDQDEFEQFMEE
jgi:hypothetical protein